MTESKSGGVMETVKTLVYAVLIALGVRTFLFEPFNIPSGSMKPTLLVGDYLFVSKFAYGYSRFSFPFGLPLFEGRIFGSLPHRGDVVVFKLPSDETTDYIKRVIGLPGDRIQMIHDVLYINGKPVDEQPAGEFPDEEGGQTVMEPMFKETLPGGATHFIIDLSKTGPLDDTPVFEVPPDHVFCMGDNRDNSLDSRTTQVGYVPVENLIGRAEILFFSVDGTARFLEPWTWPTAIRWNRLLNLFR
jgi:signal peptidase I